MSTPKRVIDDSPGDDEGELDHFGRDAAVEYLLMPERVKKLEGQVGNFAKCVFDCLNLVLTWFVCDKVIRFFRRS